MDSASAQLVSTLGASMLNELRVQYARRHQFRTHGHLGRRSGDHGAAASRSFGGARSATATRSASTSSRASRRSIDNFSLDSRPHGSRPASTRSGSPTTACAATCSSTPSRRSPRYLAAKSGANPFGYTTCSSSFGDLRVSYNSGFYGLFVQDDWQLDAAAQAALRPALRPVRRAVGAAVRGRTRTRTNFTIDKNNFGPRAGVSWALDSSARTVRARLDRPDVRAAAARLLRQRDPEQRRSGELQRVSGLPAPAPARRRFPAASRRRRRVRAAATEHQRGRSGLQDAVGVAEQRAGRARAATATSRCRSAT